MSESEKPRRLWERDIHPYELLIPQPVERFNQSAASREYLNNLRQSTDPPLSLQTCPICGDPNIRKLRDTYYYCDTCGGDYDVRVDMAMQQAELIARDHIRSIMASMRAMVDRYTVNGKREGSGQNPKMEVSWDQSYDPVKDLQMTFLERFNQSTETMLDRQSDDEARYHQRQIDNLIRATNYNPEEPSE